MVERWPHAAYLSHPPHCTLWAGDGVGDVDAAQDALAAAIITLPATTLAIYGPYVFADDPLTDHGQTCALAGSANDNLVHMQRVLCEALRAHRPAQAPESDLPAALRCEPFLTSWRRYGFPFAGRHWIPHITIASLPVLRDDARVTEFLASTESFTIPVRRVSWWRIAGDQHDRIAEWRLRPAAES
jgi:hypothetical protein